MDRRLYITWLISIASSLAYCYSQPEAYGQKDDKKHRFANYILAHCRSAVDISLNSNIDNKIRLQGGLDWGYNILKFAYFQKGLLAHQTGYIEYVDVNAGNTLVTLGVGIRYPEKQLLHSTGHLKIQEKRLILPIYLQFSWPNFLSSNTYNVITLGIQNKYLIAASYSNPDNDHAVKKTFRESSGNLRDYYALKPFSHSVCISWGIMATFGLYADWACDIPLPDPNVSIYNKGIYLETNTPKVKKDWLSTTIRLRIGVDIAKLLKALQQNTLPKSESEQNM